MFFCKKGTIPTAPDYSESNKQFDFYAYSALIDGWNIDGVDYHSGEDYLSVKRIKEYKDAGMTIYFPQSAAAVDEEAAKDWENSRAKRALDYALEAGIDKVILNDVRIQRLTKQDFGTKDEIIAMAKDGTIYQHEKYGLIGEGKQFATEADLDAYVAECLSLYKDHPAFYGIMLGDEPNFYHAESYGQMYRSLKRVAPEAYIQYNLHPIGIAFDPIWRQFHCPPLGNVDGLSNEQIIEKAYESYIRLFMEKTGATYIQYDMYPLYREEYIANWYFFALQMVSKLAKEYNAEFYFVTQTFNFDMRYRNDDKKFRCFTEADMRWLNNALVGFGVKQISYFTYFTKADNNAEHFEDGKSFITWHGEKTDMYYWMQKIMAEEQKLAPIVLNFEYKSSKLYAKPAKGWDLEYVRLQYPTPDLTAVKEVKIDKGAALVTELYDEKKGNYLYMVQNVIDPAKKYANPLQTATLTFDERYKYAAVYVKGERTTVKLKKGKLTVKQTEGEATYVMPY
ncbi:MAG: hypothetical protein IJZ32_05465 [Clostridia bacterium]|nr:hypothetical protein [Clostridia bacterium]